MSAGSIVQESGNRALSSASLDLAIPSHSKPHRLKTPVHQECLGSEKTAVRLFLGRVFWAFCEDEIGEAVRQDFHCVLRRREWRGF